MPAIPYKVIGELSTAAGLNEIIDALGGTGVSGGSTIVRDQIIGQTGTTINFSISYSPGENVLFYRNGVLMDKVISFSGGVNNSEEYQEATATSILLNPTDPAAAGETFEFVNIENAILDGFIDDARAESDGTNTLRCTVAPIANKTNVILGPEIVYSTGRNFGGVKGDLNVEVNGQSIERLLPGINDNPGDVVYEEVDTSTLNIYEIVSQGPLVTAALPSGLVINIARVRITVGTPELGGVNGVDTTANLLALPREEGRVYYSTDEDILKADDGITLNDVGAGGGDFLADGSVEMTGNLQMGANNITGISQVSGDTGTDVLFSSGTASAGTSGKVTVQSGTTGGSGLASGQLWLHSGDTVSGANPTGNVFLYSGDSAGSVSGDVTLEIGTGITRGNIIFKDGSEGTPGDVWTQQAADGSGSWATPAAGGGGSSSQIAYIKDVKPAGTDGGALTSGIWITRTLNTLEGDTGFVTLLTDDFTLDPGTYHIEGHANAFVCSQHRAKLIEVSGGANAILGSTSFSHNTSPTMSNSVLKGTITISVSTTYRLVHRGSSTHPLGFGLATNWDGDDEVYSQLKITKVA